jgi:hypothetical protein
VDVLCERVKELNALSHLDRICLDRSHVVEAPLKFGLMSLQNTLKPTPPNLARRHHRGSCDNELSLITLRLPRGAHPLKGFFTFNAHLEFSYFFLLNAIISHNELATNKFG